jgi:NAD(P)-dependent dehydrogenase (short-subunit alcohol dehydrogenase family)
VQKLIAVVKLNYKSAKYKMKKNVLITGASGNLGKATVLKLISEGYNVIATVGPGKSLEFSVEGEIDEYEADLTDEKSVEQIIKKIFAEHATLHAALLLVGGFSAGNIRATDSGLLKKMFALNFDTAYFVARPVFEHMLNQPDGGKIVFVGSRPALKAQEGKNVIAYALAKSLIFKLADFLNAEGSSKNVTASVIVPSTIDTEINRKAMPDKDFSGWVKPEEIAEALAFICSDIAKPLRDTVLKIYNRS